MELRRDGLLDLGHSTPLELRALRRVPSKSLTCKSVFRSTSPQRLPPCPPPPPREFVVGGIPISHGGRTLGPGTYDTEHPWTTDPDRIMSQFSSKASRLHKLEMPLSAELDFLDTSPTRKTAVTSAAPYSRGRTWNTSPRYPNQPARDPGQLVQTDPKAGSLSTSIANSKRLYKASFQFSGSRLHEHKTTTGRDIGPGSYNTAPKRESTLSGQRSQSMSHMFRTPSHSREVQRPKELRKMIRQEAYGGSDWVRGGTIDRHWTSKKSFSYY